MVQRRDRFSEALVAYVTTQQRRLAAGVPIHEVVPNRTVDVRPMITSSSSEAGALDSLDEFAAKLVSFNNFASPEVKLGMMHLRYQLLRVCW